MRLIHSFWSKPALSSDGIDTDNRNNGGWLHSKAHYQSWVLSCLNAKRYHGQIDLVTDRLGKEILITRLKLPYNKVSVDLDSLSSYPSNFWSLGKIFTYALQDRPFVHIDGDVFLWRSLSQYKNCELLAQHIEHNPAYCLVILNEIKGVAPLPAILSNLNLSRFTCSNAGVIGGAHPTFFKELMAISFDYVHKNQARLLRLPNPSAVNVVIEQMQFHQLAAYRNLYVRYLFGNDEPTNEDLSQFLLAPSISTFVHPLGSNAKKDQTIVSSLDMTLRYQYPKYYHRINELLREFRLR